MSDAAITTDGQGILVGVEPAQPQNAQQWAQQRPDQAVSQQPSVQLVPGGLQGQPNGARWSDEDIERARQQEKEKLYPRIDELTQQLKALRDERDAEVAERQRLADEAAAATRLQEESQMEVRDLLERREKEFQAQIDQLNNRYDTDRAIFERERALTEAREYRLARIEQEAEFILPELRDLVRGDTPQDVDASIEEMKQRSEAIFNNMAAAQAPQPFRGAAMPSVPPVGPMEQLPTQEQLSPDQIRAMDIDTYKRYREPLLQAISQQRQRGR